MGSGKTTWAINKIRNETDDKFIYITPYLDEIRRLKDSTRDFNRMYEPTYYNKTNKRDDFHRLLSEGKNVCSTHALFKKANDITRKALKANDYTLILDEVMDVVSELDNFTVNDLNTLLNEDLAYIEDDFLIWNEDKLDYDGRYNDIKVMAINKNLICINNKLMFWNFPVDIFDYFKEVYILTYLFDAQIQKYYYDYHKIKYKYYQISEFKLVDYKENRDYDKRKELKELVNIYEGKLNFIGDDDYSLSMNWHKRDDGTLTGILNNNLYNYFNNINRGCKSKYRLWTTFKNYKTTLKGKGYTRRFISLNTRATNDYRETYVLAYCCNRYIKPTINLFFKNKGIEIDQEQYALSEMLQWIWRSRIREGREINIYIPSKRMRNLLKDYFTTYSE